MRRKFAAILLALTAIFMLCGFSGTFTQGTGDYVYDEAGVFSESEKAQLNAYIASVRDKAKSDFIVVTTNNPTTSNSRDAAEAVTASWTAAGNGYGDDRQVICFYLDMANRQYYLQEYNASDKWRLSDPEIDGINQEINEYMRAGAYGTGAGKAIELAANCAKPGFFQQIWGWLTAGLVGGGAASGIAVGSHNARTTTPTRHYMAGSVQTVNVNDAFSHTTTIVQKKEVHHNNVRPSGGGGGGGNFSSGAGNSSGSHGGGMSF